MNRSTLALAVLSLLGEAEFRGEPGMHPYRIQQLIKERGKDEVVNVGQREAGRPERTLYEITDSGRAAWREWMFDMLATPRREFPEFPAAIAFIPLLTPDEVRGQLEKRRAALERELHRQQNALESLAGLPRLFQLEEEYLRGAVVFELDWVNSVIDDLRSGRLTWNEQGLRALAE